MALIRNFTSVIRRPAPVFFGALAVLGILPALIEHGGFSLSPVLLRAIRLANFAFVAAFFVEHGLALSRAVSRRNYLRDEAADFVLVLALLLTYLTASLHPFGLFEGGTLAAWVKPAQIFLLVNLLLTLINLFKVAANRRFHYARAFGISFLVIILLGTLALWLLPGAKAPGRELTFE